MMVSANLQEATSTNIRATECRSTYIERCQSLRVLDESGSRRRTTSRTVERVAEALLPTDFGEFRIIGYRSLNSNEEFVALVRGELQNDRPTLVRVHSQCLTGDVFGSTKCDCGQQLRSAMKLIADSGSGGSYIKKKKAAG